jgi:hypothetical protein
VTSELLIWVLGIGAEIALVALAARKRIYQTFPLFFAYLIWDTLDNLGLFAISYYFHPAIYFRAYLVALAIDSAFVFAVLVELAWSILRPFRSALPRGAIVAVALLIGITCAAIWPFAHSAAFSHYSFRGRLFIHLQQTISVMRVLFFLVLAGCSQLLSINWRDREMQIATGLGFYSLVGIAVSILQAGLPPGTMYHHLNQVVSVADILTILYWTYSFAREEVARREFTPQMQSFLLAVAGAARGARMSLADARSENARHRDDR